MPNLTFLDPVAQATGSGPRLLDVLRQHVFDTSSASLEFAVGFAKLRGVLLLRDIVEKRRLANPAFKSRAVIGVDLQGTSEEALDTSILAFDEVYALSVGPLRRTFHPKIYLITKANSGVAIVGSSNATGGGLETNFESSFVAEYDLVSEAAQWRALQSQVHAMLSAPIAVRLSATVIGQLAAAGYLHKESLRRRHTTSPTTTSGGAGSSSGALGSFSWPAIPLKPASPFPASWLTGRAPPSSPSAVRARARGSAAAAPPSGTPAIGTSALQRFVQLATTSLVIEITPHHNGEVFLSKIAVDQNKPFFGFPFSGTTTPKKSGNAGYPQRSPDPVVAVNVYDTSGALTLAVTNYNLNTVFYEPKSEIRITLSSTIFGSAIGSRALLHMRADDPTVDYVLDIYQPGSVQYVNLLAACNQQMPSGGASVPRRFGWL